jgi:hypothetical protein
MKYLSIKHKKARKKRSPRKIVKKDSGGGEKMEK